MKESFNPSDKKYKKVEDLPEEERNKYVDFENGFVLKDAMLHVFEDEFEARMKEDSEFFVERVAEIQEEAIYQEFMQEVELDECYYKEPAPQITREMMLRAVKENGKAFEYAIPELRADREVVLEAVRSNPYMLRLASPELQNDREIVLSAVSKYGDALELASPGLRADREVVLEAIKETGFALRHASPELQNDREIVMMAVKQYPATFAYASPELHGDRELVLMGTDYERSWDLRPAIGLRFASPELKADRNFVLDAIAKNFHSIAYAARELLRDPSFIIDAMRRNHMVVLSLLRYNRDKIEEFQRDLDRAGELTKELHEKYIGRWW